MRFLFIVALPLASAFAPADVTSMGTPSPKTTTNGPIVGRIDASGTERYFGIPTAADASGANRWKAPQPYTWTTPLQTTVEKPCSQYRSATSIVGTEDCISVDVMTHSQYTNMPVAFWVHGGGFTREDLPFEHMTAAYYTANGAQPYLPNGGRVMHTLLHYRISTFGWMAHPGFSTETTYGGSGNYGLMDAITGLTWVRDNAATFNGDATRVTVFGESAGAAHTTAIVASPLSVGLIHNTIIESPFISWAPATYSMNARYAMDSMITNATGCGPIGVSSGAAATAEAACLRTKTFTEANENVGYQAMNAFDAIYGSGSGYLFLYSSVTCWPVVDGYALTTDPLASFASGNNAAVNVIIGHNADEYTSFYLNTATDYMSGAYPLVDQAWNLGLGAAPFALSNTATVESMIAAMMASAAPAVINSVSPLYPMPTDAYQNTVQKTTDAWFTAGVDRVIMAMYSSPARLPGTVYRFFYGQEMAPPGDAQFNFVGACHGCELDYVLGIYEEATSYFFADVPSMTVIYDTAHLNLGNSMKNYWVNMFYQGHPNHDSAMSGTYSNPVWHPQSASDKHVMYFKADIPGGAALDPCIQSVPCRAENVLNLRARKIAFWQSDPSYMSATDGSCARPQSFLSQNNLGNSCTQPPPATCSTWCNVYTCAMAACEGCSDCVAHSQSQTCEGWCNSYTCDMNHCAGCPVSMCAAPGQACYSWCNSYTCWMPGSVCAGCSFCP